MVIDPPRFLDELCVKLGLCLDLAARGRIGRAAFRDVDALELAILEAERLDPLTVSRRLRQDLRDLITRHWDTAG